MKIKHLFFSIALTLCWCGYSFAQIPSMTLKEYREMVREKTHHYDSLRIQNNGNFKATDYKKFLRFDMMHGSEIRNDGGPDLFFTNLIQAQNTAPYGNTPRSTSKTDNYQGEWREIGPVYKAAGPGINRMRGTGRLYFIEFDDINNRMFTGSALGGLWYSENAGQSWNSGGTDYLPQPGVSHMQVAANTNDGKTWFVVTGDAEMAFGPSDGVWRTTNKGQTWEKMNQGNSLAITGNAANPFIFWARCRKILAHPTDPNILFAAYSHGLYRTTNALAPVNNIVWERVADNSVMSFFFDVAFKPGTNGQTVIVSGDRVAISTNGGGANSFTLLPNINNLKNTHDDDNDRISFRFSESNPDIFYGAFGGQPHKNNQGASYGSPSYVFKYDLSTSSLTDHTVGSYRYSRHQAMAVNPTDEDEVLLANVNPIYKSTDGGQTFNSLFNSPYPIHDDYHWITYHGSSEIWAATDGGIAKSIDGGNTWQDMTNNIGSAVYFSISSCEKKPDVVIGGGWDTGSNIHDPATNSFKTFNATGDAFESLIDDSDPDNLTYYVSLTNGYDLLRYDNNSLTSRTNVKPPQSVGPRVWPSDFCKSEINQSILFYSGQYSVGRTTDRGNTWASISPALTNGYHRVTRVAPSDNNTLYTYVIGDISNSMALKLTKSSNAMAPAAQVTWTDITPALSNYNNGQTIKLEIIDIAINNTNPDEIWVTMPGFDPQNPKVLHYDGTTWSNITGSGLDNVSVKRIAYQYGTDGLVYIGTNNGVFYKKNGETSWKKLFGIPHASISDMEISHCAGMLRASAYGRGIWEAELVQDYAPNDITANTIWNQDEIINSPVVVKAGATLTITSTISLGKQAGIKIEKGGKLILDGGHLTNDCEKWWAGIAVEGTSGQIQNSTNCGILEIKNGGKISHARTAITNSDWDENGVIWSEIGGMIFANGAIFENNNRDVQFMQFHHWANANYERDYQAKFYNCDFICNDDFRIDVKYHHITMWDVEGVQIKGCRFQNTNTSDWKHETSALWTGDATYHVGKWNDVPSEFKGYNKAIFADNTVRLDKQLKIYDAIFDNNRYGIHIKSTANAKIIGNSIDVDYVDVGVFDNPAQYGLYFDHSYCYVFHNNELTSASSANPGHDAIGAVFRNNGEYANLIYRNSFDGFDIAAEALGYNKNPNNTNGLNFRCNRFGDNTANYIDIYVNKDPKASFPANQVGIAEWQGSVINNSGQKKNLANNLFSNAIGSGFDNREYPVLYYTANNGSEPRLNPSAPLGVSLTNYSFAIFDYSEDCNDPESVDSGWGNELPVGIASDINEGDLFVSGKKALLQQLIDEGDGPLLEAEILAASQPEYQELYTDLMEIAPYVSEENMINTVEIPDFPELALRNILIANPHASRSPEVMEAVYNREPPLSAQTLSEIEAGEATITSKDVLEGDISNANVHLHNSIRKLVNFYVNDSIGEDPLDSLETLLNRRKEVYYRYALIDNYISLGRYNDATDQISAIPNDCELSDFEDAEYQGMGAFYSVVISALEEPLPLNALSSHYLVNLQNIAAQSIGLGVSRAQDLLILNENDVDYIEPTVFPDLGSGKKSISSDNSVRPLHPETGFSLFPNPASSHILIRWNWFKAGLQSTVTVELMDVTGKHIDVITINDYQKNTHIYPINELSKGVYIIKISSGNNTLHTEKLTVVDN